MTATPTTAIAPHATPRLFVVIFAAAIALALVPTLWSALDLRLAALFAGPDAQIAAVNWWWVKWINDYVPTVFRYFLLLALLGWIASRFRPRWQAWSLPLAFVFLAGVLGPGAVVNWGFKEHWQRARPYQVQELGGTQQFTRATVMTDQCNNNCSFVSGHVSCGVFLISIGLVHRRRQRIWAAAGVSAGLLIGFSRMADVAHWFSDVLWAFPITLATSWLVWKALLMLQARPSRTVG